MELKDFQQGVLDTLDRYLDALNTYARQSETQETLRRKNPTAGIEVSDFTAKAWDNLRGQGVLPTSRAETPFHARKDGVGRAVPAVCLKVPTGGGKTLLGVESVARILNKWLRRNTGFVLWVVPNDAIYTQTKKALTNREHPYRQTLERAAAGRVRILEKDSPLSKADVDASLCIMLLMLQSANRQTKTKETLRLFRDRGNVHGFFPAGDDFLAHEAVLQATPNLDTYTSDVTTIGTAVKDSLGNVLRITRPIVVMDEGHRAYSALARNTVAGFNPSFLLELSATPPDTSNWLVDVRGVALEREGMIKLPINVRVRAGDDWKATMREALEQLNDLQRNADRLQADANRHVRPICLVQVERTGKEQRDPKYVHSDDAREYLLTLGVKEHEIAIKTSDRNELDQPENRDLLSPTNTIRFIITKYALQEGWDCPFAYVLCALAPSASRAAMTQLVGRILRQPDTIKTGVPALDECIVVCQHATTKEVVDIIANSLRSDGMGDLIGHIRDVNANGDGDAKRELRRRDDFRALDIYLPTVLWIGNGAPRELDYEQDILFRLDWDEIKLGALAKELGTQTQEAEHQVVRIDLASNLLGDDIVQTRQVGRIAVTDDFDAVYATRSILDVLPNPWVGREVVGQLLDELRQQGLTDQELAARSSYLIDGLHGHLLKERDRLAEQLFESEVQAGHIQFRLRTDGRNWEMPKMLFTSFAPNSPRLQRDDGAYVQTSLFDPVYADELNSYEQKVAGYLDADTAMRWWHRNVARQPHYAIQGWRKDKVYPDFIFALKRENGADRLIVLETKGIQLSGNPDTVYKQQLLSKCSRIFQFEKVTRAGELEIVIDPNTTVTCHIVLQDTWQKELSAILAT